MKPTPITFYVYSDDDKQIRRLQEALYDFVSSKFNSGIIVTADKLSNALTKFGNNPIVNQYLK